MFTKNKILLCLALALFTFAAPNRAQALPYFFQTYTYIGNTSAGWAVYSSPDFGLFSFHPDPAYAFPFIYKWDFGWIWWFSANEDAYGGWFWDYTTNSLFYTDARYYNWRDITLRQFSEGVVCIPDYTTYDAEYTYFWSAFWKEWVFYYDAPRNCGDFRHFEHTTVNGGGGFDYPPCWSGCVGGG